MSSFILKELNSKTYRIHKFLLYFVCVLLLSISIVGLYENDWKLSNSYYSTCNDREGCINPYFGSPDCLDVNSPYYATDICNLKNMYFGQSIGVKPSFINKFTYELTFGIILLWLVVNHLLFNKGFFKGVELKL